MYDCPAGTYGDVKGLSTPACSGFCDPGYFCPEGSNDKQKETCGAGLLEEEAIKRYCPSGTSSRLLVDSSHYTTPESGSKYTRSGQIECPTGYTCVEVRYLYTNISVSC